MNMDVDMADATDELYKHPEKALKNKIYVDKTDHWYELGADVCWTAMYTQQEHGRRSILSPTFDQGELSCCWAASTKQSVEAMFRIYLDCDIQLSIQELIDCVPRVNEPLYTHRRVLEGPRRDYAGNPKLALDYINLYGLSQEHNYRFNTEKMKQNPPKKSFEIFKIKVGKPGAIRDMMYDQVRDQIACQPVVARLEAHPNLKGVKNEIYLGETDLGETASAAADLNHYVQLVGYGTDKFIGIDYFVVRNSWGDEWGPEDGKGCGRLSVGLFRDFYYPKFINPFITYLPHHLTHHSLLNFAI